MITKTIHITWKDTTFPHKYKRCIESWVRLNPEWKVMLWTDDSFKQFVGDVSEYREHLSRVNNFKKGIILGDFVRLLTVYHYGGLYVDCDFECLKPVDTWELDQNMLNVAHEPAEHESIHNTKNIVCNALFAAPPRQEILMDILQQGNVVNDGSPLEVLKSYGPLAWTKHINQSKVNILPTEQYYPIPDLTAPGLKYKNKSKKELFDITSKRSWTSNAVHYWDHSNIKRESILDIFTQQTNAIER